MGQRIFLAVIARCCFAVSRAPSPVLFTLFLLIFESLRSWGMQLAWLDVGWEGTCLEETPAALQEQSHPVCPWLVRSGVGGGWGMEDAWPDVATEVACVDVPQRCLLMSFPLPSCTPCSGTRGRD